MKSKKSNITSENNSPQIAEKELASNDVFEQVAEPEKTSDISREGSEPSAEQAFDEISSEQVKSGKRKAKVKPQKVKKERKHPTKFYLLVYLLPIASTILALCIIFTTLIFTGVIKQKAPDFSIQNIGNRALVSIEDKHASCYYVYIDGIRYASKSNVIDITDWLLTKEEHEVKCSFESTVFGLVSNISDGKPARGIAMLEKPVLTMAAGKIQWQKIENASGYEVYLDGQKHECTDAFFSLTSCSAGKHTIKVTPTSNETNVFRGESATMEFVIEKKLATPTCEYDSATALLTITNNGADKYILHFDNGMEKLDIYHFAEHQKVIDLKMFFSDIFIENLSEIKINSISFEEGTAQSGFVVVYTKN